MSFFLRFSGVEEAVVRSAKRSTERRTGRFTVLQEPTVPSTNQDHQPEPV